MGQSLLFSLDVFRTICDRLHEKAADLRHLVEMNGTLEQWLKLEALLACKSRQESYPYSEVEARPTYASEGVLGEGGEPVQGHGTLRVGGPNEGADHCWVFAEIVLLHGNDERKGLERIEAAVEKLKRLGWKKSAALLIVVAASRADAEGDWVNDPANYPTGGQLTLTEPFLIPLPGGGAIEVKAFDIKRNPADILASAAVD